MAYVRGGRGKSRPLPLAVQQYVARQVALQRKADLAAISRLEAQVEKLKKHIDYREAALSGYKARVENQERKLEDSQAKLQTARAAEKTAKKRLEREQTAHEKTKKEKTALRTQLTAQKKKRTVSAEIARLRAQAIDEEAKWHSLRTQLLGDIEALRRQNDELTEQLEAAAETIKAKDDQIIEVELLLVGGTNESR